MPAENIGVAVILVAVGKRWIVERIRAGGLGGGGRGFECGRAKGRVKLPSSCEHAFQRRAQGRKPRPRRRRDRSGVLRRARCLGMRVFCLPPNVANAEGYGKRGGAC